MCIMSLFECCGGGGGGGDSITKVMMACGVSDCSAYSCLAQVLCIAYVA